VAIPAADQRTRLRPRQLGLIDCTFAEFDAAIGAGEIVEVEALEPGVQRELVLITGWQRPLHVVVVADQNRREERIVTVYEPDAGSWSDDYRRRR
jgi:hypothetical protein